MTDFILKFNNGTGRNYSCPYYLRQEIPLQTSLMVIKREGGQAQHLRQKTTQSQPFQVVLH